MCDQTEIEYKHGDIVWVKLANTWWPGEVVSFESLPLEITAPLKSKPLVTVKFFQEENYEFIRKPTDIYFYNCSMKNEFITKGLKLYRNKNKYMEKFPTDICTAETRTDGDPNILNDPIFAPPKKVDLSEIFGTPKKSISPKKKRKVQGSGERKSKDGFRNIITHPRFLGKDDHQVHELIQTPKSSPVINTKLYNCPKCEFTTGRIEVMIFHSKSHSKPRESLPKKSKKIPKKQKLQLKLPRTKTTSIDEDLELLQKGYSIGTSTSSENDEAEIEQQKKPRKKKAKRKPEPEVIKPKDVRTDILAEWQENSDEEEETDLNNSSVQEKTEKLNQTNSDLLNKAQNVDDKKEVASKLPQENISDTNKKEIDKEQLDNNNFESSLPTYTVYGGKAKVNLQKQDNSLSSEEIFKDVLEKTSVPTIPSMPDLPKQETNVEKVKTTKIEKPDAHPKKRFVKSFEDFELFLKNQMSKEAKLKETENDEELNKDKKSTTVTNAEEATEKVTENKTDTDKKESENLEQKNESITGKEVNNVKEEVKNLEVSKLKSQLMNKLVTACERKPTKPKEEPIVKEKPNLKTEKAHLKIEKSDSKIKKADSKIEKAESKIEKTYSKIETADLLTEKVELGIEETDSKIENTDSKIEKPDSKIEKKDSNIEKADSNIEKTDLKIEKAALKNEKAHSKFEETDSKIEKTEKTDAKTEKTELKIEDQNEINLNTENESLRKVPEIVNKEETKIDSTTTSESKIVEDVAKNEIEASVNSTLDVTLEDMKKIELEASESHLNKNVVIANDKEDTPSELKEENCTVIVANETVDKVTEENKSSVTNQITATNVPLSDITSDISSDEMCPLSTLAAVSELSTTIDSNAKQDANFSEVKSPGNLTVMTENELANVEVEIAAGSNLGEDKVTLTTFSVDFPDDKEINEKDNTKKYLDEKEDVSKPSESSESDVAADETKPVEAVDNSKNSVESEIAKLTDTDPDTEVITEKPENTSSSKLLKILTDNKTIDNMKTSSSSQSMSNNVVLKPAKSSKDTILTKVVKPDIKGKIVLKSSAPSPSNKSGKPIILSEKILTPVAEGSKVAVKKVVTKRSFAESGDIDKFIIQRTPKRAALDEEAISSLPKYAAQKGNVSTPKGKARILQQTIITAAGTIIQPNISQAQADDGNVFDINSMPIVLSDQILTPESIENMPIVISEQVQTSTPQKVSEKVNVIQKQSNQQVKLLNKSAASVIMKETPSKMTTSTIKMTPKITKQKVYQSGSKLKNTSIISPHGKPGKFVIVPPVSSATGSKYTVGKRSPIIKRSPATGALGTATKFQSMNESGGGGKIMIVAHEHAQPSRVILTPAQQKMLGYSSATSKIVKNTIKGNILQKNIIKDGSINLSKSSTSQGIVSSKTVMVSNSTTNVFSSASPLKAENTRFVKKLPNQLLSGSNKPTTQYKTVVIKNNKGQTIKRIQATDDALLEQQVAEQLEAINKAAAAKKMILKTTPGKMIEKKTFIRKQITGPSGKQLMTSTTGIVSPSVSTKSMNVPPLAPISPIKKSDSMQIHTSSIINEKSSEEAKTEQQRPPHQLIIQDAGGYQTTITEGQILALPSETVDGQPQSYMLVTLDETGNLTPLNNEALMALDPNLNLGGDLGNMVLQIDQGDQTVKSVASTKPETVPTTVAEETKSDNVVVSTPSTVEENVDVLPSVSENTESSVDNTVQESLPATTETTTVQGIACNINNGDVNQQLLITGDPAATQKFLESLTEGNPDLANLLANAEGNILIHADGQQILINTDPDNQMMIMNPENAASTEANESSGNPVFSGQPAKNQDILAAALADTDVFQQEPNQIKVTQSQLSPTNGMYPINVGNVLETSSMNSPIMTPLEIPSTNSKKIEDEANILSQVPKNVDLPITITDPNISQTVAQQQVTSLMVNELQNNLELPLSISDPTISATATEMNSPNFVYSLPTLDDSDINQKTFSSSISMPLLTEENEEVLAETSEASEGGNNLMEDVKAEEKLEKPEETLETQDEKPSFISSVDDGLCTIRGSMCNSLSEPPPDMFEFPITSDSDNKISQDIPITSALSENSQTHEENANADLFNDDKPNKENYQNFEDQKVDTPSTNTDENSCEIPVQPEIVTDLMSNDSTLEKPPTEPTELSAKRSCEIDESEEEQSAKKSKLD